ncbi:MAG: S9 family peptidase, partial [Nitrosospira sp.]|nr:S9 family peptidase [Nitrosospira sp.]
MATTSIMGASFSADEKRILFTSNATGIFNAYTLPVEGGTPEPLTQSTVESTFSVSFFPHDDRVLFMRDCGGDENYHLFLLDRDGTERDLTPGEKLKAQFMGWRPDGSAFFV